MSSALSHRIFTTLAGESPRVSVNSAASLPPTPALWQYRIAVRYCLDTPRQLPDHKSSTMQAPGFELTPVRRSSLKLVPASGQPSEKRTHYKSVRPSVSRF